MSLCPFEEYEKRRKEFEEEDDQSSSMTELTIKVGSITLDELEVRADASGCTVERQAYVLLSHWAVKESRRRQRPSKQADKPKESKPLPRRCAPRRNRRARR